MRASLQLFIKHSFLVVSVWCLQLRRCGHSRSTWRPRWEAAARRGRHQRACVAACWRQCGVTLHHRTRAGLRAPTRAHLSPSLISNHVEHGGSHPPPVIGPCLRPPADRQTECAAAPDATFCFALFFGFDFLFVARFRPTAICCAAVSKPSLGRWNGRGTPVAVARGALANPSSPW